MRVVVITAGVLVALSGCSVEIAGTPGTAPERTAATATVSATPTAPAPAPVSAPAGPRSALTADPIADECLLDASEIGALVGMAVRPPRESTLVRPDGSMGRSCVATTAADPVAMINVYRTQTGTPAEYVRGGGPHRDLAGVGEAAAVFDTGAGPTLQVASAGYLVTILVAKGTPADGDWREAATAALAALPH